MADENLSYKWNNMTAGEILENFKLDIKTFQQNNSSSNFADCSDAGGFIEQEIGAIELGDDLRSPEDFEYDMKNAERGCFVIFVHDKYDEVLDVSAREGSAIDATKMQQIAQRLGFEYIKICRNFDRKSILSLLEQMRSGSHHGYDCFGCAILSHGEEGDVIYASDAKMQLKEFFEPFSADKCPTLSGKPKLFFIQACRGGKVDIPTKAHSKTQCDADAVVDEHEESGSQKPEVEQTPLKPVMIPTQADFLIAHATPSDFTAWRNEQNGSWFVHALWQCFQTHGHNLELMQIMTKVNNMVSGYRIRDGTVTQIPSFASQLRAEVKFDPKRSEPEPSRTEPARGDATRQGRYSQVSSDNWM